MASAKTKAAAKAQNLAELKPFTYEVKVRSTVISYRPKWVAMPTVGNILDRDGVYDAWQPIFNNISELDLKGVSFELKCKETEQSVTFKSSTTDASKFHNALKDAIVGCQFSSDKNEYDSAETTCKHAIMIYNRRNGLKPDAVTGYKVRFDKADLVHQVKTTRSVVKLMAEAAAVTAKGTPLAELAAKLAATKQLGAPKK